MFSMSFDIFTQLCWLILLGKRKITRDSPTLNIRLKVEFCSHRDPMTHYIQDWSGSLQSNLVRKKLRERAETVCFYFRFYFYLSRRLFILGSLWFECCKINQNINGWIDGWDGRDLYVYRYINIILHWVYSRCAKHTSKAVDPILGVLSTTPASNLLLLVALNLRKRYSKYLADGAALTLHT